MNKERSRRKRTQKGKKRLLPFITAGVLMALAFAVSITKMRESAVPGPTEQPREQKEKRASKKTEPVEENDKQDVLQRQTEEAEPKVVDVVPQPQQSPEEENEDNTQQPVTTTEPKLHATDDNEHPCEPQPDVPEPSDTTRADVFTQKTSVPADVTTSTDPEDAPNDSASAEQPSPATTPTKNHAPVFPTEQKGERTGGSSTDFAEPLTLYGGNTNTPEQQALWRLWMERMINREKVSELVPILETRLREIIPQLISGDRLNYTSYKNSRSLVKAVELCYLAKLVEPTRLDAFLKSERMHGEESKMSPKNFMKWLLIDRSRPLHQLLQAFALNSGRAAEFPRTLKVFYELWKRTPERDNTRYMNLAIACSLIRSDAAHSPGMLRMPDEHLLSIPELYDYYRTQDIKNALITNIHKLGVAELLHVVDVRLPMSEFEWVKRKLNYQRSNWGAAYSGIEYIMERATQDVDPYKLYTFEEIKELGGVCRDQAYFCSATAKTRGLPAVTICGDGDRGPHAWVALYTSEKNGWTTVGSYGYKTGRYIDPCSGLSVHESALTGKDNKLPPERQESAGNCMVLSDYLCRTNSKAEGLGCARFVTLAYPQLTSSWRNYVDVMEQSGSESVNLAAWRRLYAELGHQVKKNMELMDLAQYVQANHVMEGKKDNVKLNVLKRSSRKLDELIQAGRVDLAIESIERQAKIYADNADYRGLASFFKGYFKDYGQQTNTFGMMLELYMRKVDDCAKKIRADGKLDEKAKENLICGMWRTCAKDAEGAFGKGALDSNDFFAVKKVASIMHEIAECWRLSGDEKRAQRMETVAEERYQEIRERSTDKRSEQLNRARRRK